VPGLSATALTTNPTRGRTLRVWLCVVTLALAVPPATSLVAGAADGPQAEVIHAARSGDLGRLRARIGTDTALANAAEADGTTLLLWAVRRNDRAMVDFLLAAGADVRRANRYGIAPLNAACAAGYGELAVRLVAAGADVNGATPDGETPLMSASRAGAIEAVKALIARGANVNARERSHDQTALMWAVAQKHPEVVKVLLAHGADIKARSAVWNEVMAVPPHGYLPYNKAIPHGGETALMFAARVGDLESAKLLIAAGANVNDADAWGVSATVLAAHSGFGDIVELLLDKGADPNKAEAGFTALHEAIMRRDEKTVGLLLAHGADANAQLKTWTPVRRSSHDYYFSPALVGATPFWLAARFTQPNVMRMLLKHGADPKFVMQSDYMTGRNNHRKETTTALTAAMGMGGGVAWVQAPKAEREALALEAVKLVAELGVDINAPNVDGRTALDAANSLHYESVAQFLTAKGGKASGKPAPREAVAD